MTRRIYVLPLLLFTQSTDSNGIKNIHTEMNTIASIIYPSSEAFVHLNWYVKMRKMFQANFLDRPLIKKCYKEILFTEILTMCLLKAVHLKTSELGPVAQSIVSLTTSLCQLVKYMPTTLSNTA